ncbi:ABC transporter permease [Rufibacter sediminis]|uniref:ABC transporter permease n=1 Tax=Rufibacter sediminis TaxID=2762756 RepID=A0ABR6VZM5_9BACT|nr:ABC transporter permease subunit [Rufibacter sediminis]MBC3542319.1 ABC transporter permease [Rufibacter sediminis]
MDKGTPRHTFSLTEKLSITWLILFTAAALISQVFVWQGKQAMASPEQAYLTPFSSLEHPLGTDQLGRDVLFYLFLSCRTAWLIAIPPLLLATGIGVLLGTGAAILGNHGLKVSVINLLLLAFLVLAYLFVFPVLHHYPPFQGYTLLYWVYYGSAAFLVYVVLSLDISARFSFLQKKVAVGVDEGLQKVITIWSSLPKLLLLLILTAFTPFSMLTLLGWICATYWVLPARIARANVLQLKKESYYETAEALGIPFRRVFTYFLLPSLKGPILTTFCFAASGLLGIGSTLAYLGIGIPADVPSWGKMLAVARYSVEAWWLLVFPAFFLLASIFSLQVIGHHFTTRNRAKSVTE